MNQLSGAEALVRMLQLHGVRHIFGLCGDTSLPLYDALYRLDHGITPHPDARRALGRLHGRRLCARHRPGRRLRGAERRRRHLHPAGRGRGQRSPRSRCSASPPTSRSPSRGRYALTELDQEALFRPLTKWNRVIDQAAARSRRRCAPAFPPDDHRPAGRRASRPAVRRAEGSRSTRPRSGPIRRSACFPARRTAPDPARSRRRPSAARGRSGRSSSAAAASVIAGAEAELRRSPERLGDRRSRPRSAARAASPRTIRSRSAWSAAMAARPRRARWSIGRDLVVFVGCRAGSVTTERWRHPAPGRRGSSTSTSTRR